MQGHYSLRLLVFIAVLLSCLQAIRTFRDVATYGDIDLRDKIVGARLLAEEKSPYFYKWKERDDDRLLDPLHRRDMHVTRVTVPPSFLLLFVPLSKSDHGVIQWIWFAFSYFCFILILFQFTNLSQHGRKEYVWLAGLFFFMCSMAWSMHIERGQNYIFLTALLTTVYWLCKKEQFLIAGITMALLCWLRLPFLICLPLLIVLPQKKKFIAGFISSACILAVVSLCLTSLQNWVDYFSAVQEWSRFEINEMNIRASADVVSLPTVIEGEANLGSMKGFWQNNRSVQSLFRDMLDIKLYATHLLCLFIIVVAGISVFLVSQIKKNNIRIDMDKAFILIFLLYILTEYFSPAPAYSYHYVQWIFPVLLCFSKGWIKMSSSSAIILLGLAMNLGVMSFAPYNLVLGEALLYAGVARLIVWDRV